ncbi:MAG TPA: GerMN domain-containing protein [Thermoanaerobaculia bacterium]|nr:GerMN domain-containing protein [Thermoanaerobaculia bacterium]
MNRKGVAMVRRSRAPWGWLLPLVLLAVFYCTPSETEPLNLRADSPTGRVRVFLIAPEDGGGLGRKAPCSDSAVPVVVELPRQRPALEGALEALLALDGRYDRTTGFYNPLYASPLEIQRIERAGAEARVYLTGYVEVGGDCDGPRMLAQLTETALQFEDVQQVQFYLGGKPLGALLGS